MHKFDLNRRLPYVALRDIYKNLEQKMYVQVPNSVPALSYKAT